MLLCSVSDSVGISTVSDLSYFDHIVPCGISDKAVPSLEEELGKKLSITEGENKLLKHFIDIFEIEKVESASFNH